MSDTSHAAVEQFMLGLRRRNPGEEVFHQAVQEVADTVMPTILDSQAYRDNQILERMTEPDRVIIFRVSWRDDEGNFRVNRAYRVQFNNAIGPYKGGLRFHPSVNLAILKFLGFEQTFKNSLTTLPMGGGKGGANFNPKGKTDAEVMRFCQSMMIELARHIGPDRDVPAGDIGVGAREIGYLFGCYKRLCNDHTGVLTGKGLEYGGSLIRTEATGYGLCYFVQNMLNHRGDSFDGKTVIISGSGNVAQYACEKANEFGGKVVTLSDSSGFIHDPNGVSGEKLEYVKWLKGVKRGRIHEYADKYGCEFVKGKRPWGVNCDIALPCATQNELSGDDAATLISNGVLALGEGANMPTDLEGVRRFLDAKIMYAPAKAANAGGVACSGLEMSQNSLRVSWTREEVDQRLQGIMKSIHAQCIKHGGHGDYVDYVQGANVAGFVKVADAMLAYGVM